MVLDGTITHSESDALIQISPTKADSDEKYDANRVLVQDGKTEEKYYVAHDSSGVEIPQEGISHAVKTGSLDEASIHDAATFVPYDTVHGDAGSTLVDTRTTFWTPDMVVVAVFAGAKEVASGRMTQTGLASF